MPLRGVMKHKIEDKEVCLTLTTETLTLPKYLMFMVLPGLKYLIMDTEALT